MADERLDTSDLLLYGSIGFGVAAGAMLVVYLVSRRHADRLLPPLQRAERMIENCEARIQEIQQSMQAVQSQIQSDGQHGPAIATPQH